MGRVADLPSSSKQRDLFHAIISTTSNKNKKKNNLEYHYHYYYYTNMVVSQNEGTPILIDPKIL